MEASRSPDFAFSSRTGSIRAWLERPSAPNALGRLEAALSSLVEGVAVPGALSTEDLYLSVCSVSDDEPSRRLVVAEALARLRQGEAGWDA